MQLYKLTRHNGTTYNGTEWGPGVQHTVPGGYQGICGAGWLHAYEDPLLAVLHNPVHANFTDFRLWEAKGGGRVSRDEGMKIMVTTLSTIQEIPAPVVTQRARLTYGLLVLRAIAKDDRFSQEVDKWVAGEDIDFHWPSNWTHISSSKANMRARLAVVDMRDARSSFKSAMLVDTDVALAVEKASGTGFGLDLIAFARQAVGGESVTADTEFDRALETAGLTRKLYELEDNVYGVPSSYGKVKKGDWYQNSMSNRPTRAGSDLGSDLRVLFAVVAVPPKPDDSLLSRLAPKGRRLVLDAVPNNTSVPYINSVGDCVVTADIDNRDSGYCAGYRWGVTIQDVPTPKVTYLRRVRPPGSPERRVRVGKLIDGRVAEYYVDGKPVTEDIGRYPCMAYYEPIDAATYLRLGRDNPPAVVYYNWKHSSDCVTYQRIKTIGGRCVESLDYRGAVNPDPKATTCTIWGISNWEPITESAYEAAKAAYPGVEYLRWKGSRGVGGIFIPDIKVVDGQAVETNIRDISNALAWFNRYWTGKQGDTYSGHSAWEVISEAEYRKAAREVTVEEALLELDRVRGK